jgi:hypothetical protein
MSSELQALQQRLRALLHANMEEVGRTIELLADAERKVEDRFGHIDSLETTWELAARKLRKQPVRETARPAVSRNSESNIQL